MAEGNYDQLWDDAWGQASSSGPGFLSRYRLLERLLQQYPVSGRLLDVGAGHGGLLSRLALQFPRLELHAHETAPRALELLCDLPAVDKVVSGNLSGLTPGHYGGIVCSEVLEHIDDDRGTLSAMTKLLSPGGRLFLTVPLREELWTPVDEAVGHRRRYERGQLEELCAQMGLEVECSMAVGAPFYNGYYRLLGRKSPRETAARGRGRMAQLAARLLTELFVFEARWSSPWGGRGIVVARNPSTR